MKYRPNISAISNRKNLFLDKMETLSNLVLNDMTGSILAEKTLPTPSKTKSIVASPILNLIKNTELDKKDVFVNLVLNNETGSTLADRPEPIPSKTKSNPIPNIQPNYLDRILDYKFDIFDFIASDTKLYPDLLVEYSTYYVVTISTNQPMQGYDSLTSKDFDIYVNGIRLDVPDYRVWFNEIGNIVFTIQKTAIPNDLTQANFLICGAFKNIIIGTETDIILSTENGEEIIL